MFSIFLIIIFALLSIGYITFLSAAVENNSDGETIGFLLTGVFLVVSIIGPILQPYKIDSIEITDYKYNIDDKIEIYYNDKKIYNDDNFKIYKALKEKENKPISIIIEKNYFGSKKYKIDIK